VHPNGNPFLNICYMFSWHTSIGLVVSNSLAKLNRIIFSFLHLIVTSHEKHSHNHACVMCITRITVDTGNMVGDTPVPWTKSSYALLICFQKNSLFRGGGFFC